MSADLIHKYNVPGPRYTSYPTVPYWNEAGFSLEQWQQTLKTSFIESNDTQGISLYLHMPFCESLCTFCGCHKRITKRHDVELPYIDYMLREWDLYLDLLEEKPRIKELHLGGGTPTFFSPENLKILLDQLLDKAHICHDAVLSFEGHPNNTSEAHLQMFYDLGFRRVSFGIQDYDPTVQTAINRHQSFEQVTQIHNLARDMGYTSISHDLVFGLPFQTAERMLETIRKTNELRPDRIAFYSYAHVPWIKGNGQRGFNDEDLPSGEEKRALYEQGKHALLDLGYVEIGMDHFSLPSDDLYKAQQNRDLHRNFMGYNASSTQVMIGLGVSSISDSWYSFAQNEKKIEDYYQAIDAERIPVYRGHILDQEDLIIRRHIIDLMCHFETHWTDEEQQFPELNDVLEALQEMQADGLLVIDREQQVLQITDKGQPFVRNACMAFDLLLKRKRPQTQLFSMTV